MNTDCQDKRSTHYFQCHMTQEDWETILEELKCLTGTVEEYTFNKIRKIK